MTLTEDFPDRLPGPELGDYAGLPLNASDRLRAMSWSASILSLPDYQCRVHPSDYANSFADIRMWHEINTSTQELDRDPLAALRVADATNVLDGRPRASAGLRGAHVDGLLDRRVGRQHAEGDDHAFEGRLAAPQRRRAQRQRDRDGALHSPRQPPHLERVRSGSEISRGAVLPQSRLHVAETGSIGAYPCESVVEVLLPEHYFPHYLPGQNPFLIEYRAQSQDPDRGRDGRCCDDVSGVPQEDGDAAATRRLAREYLPGNWSQR